VWEDGVFNEYSRQNLPLSVRLRGFSDRLLSRLYNMQLDQVAELTRQDVVELVSEIRCEPIALGNVIANWTGPYMPPRSYFAAMPLVAGPEFVRFWPDEINGIEPIDASDATAAEQWVFGNVVESPTRVGIFTMIQLSEAEEELEETQPTLEQRLTERIDKAKRYVDAQAEQMQRFFDEKLVDLGMQVVEQRQRTRRIVANLGFPSSWKIPEPKLITEPSDQSDESAGGVVGSTDQSSTLPLDESTTVDHVVPQMDASKASGGLLVASLGRVISGIGWREMNRCNTESYLVRAVYVQEDRPVLHGTRLFVNVSVDALQPPIGPRSCRLKVLLPKQQQ
jgi:hypothetical protein